MCYFELVVLGHNLDSEQMIWLTTNFDNLDFSHSNHKGAIYQTIDLMIQISHGSLIVTVQLSKWKEEKDSFLNNTISFMADITGWAWTR